MSPFNRPTRHLRDRGVRKRLARALDGLQSAHELRGSRFASDAAAVAEIAAEEYRRAVVAYYRRDRP